MVNWVSGDSQNIPDHHDLDLAVVRRAGESLLEFTHRHRVALQVSTMVHPNVRRNSGIYGAETSGTQVCGGRSVAALDGTPPPYPSALVGHQKMPSRTPIGPIDGDQGPSMTPPAGQRPS